MKYLLDTCTFLWLVQQPRMLSPAAVSALDDAESELFVSDVSLWEVTLKHAAGKLPLPDAPRMWIPQKLAHHELGTLALTQEAIFRSSELPRGHADPFDRLFAAQALGASLVLLSPDAPLSLLGVTRVW